MIRENNTKTEKKDCKEKKRKRKKKKIVYTKRKFSF